MSDQKWWSYPSFTILKMIIFNLFLRQKNDDIFLIVNSIKGSRVPLHGFWNYMIFHLRTRFLVPILKLCCYIIKLKIELKLDFQGSIFFWKINWYNQYFYVIFLREEILILILTIFHGSSGKYVVNAYSMTSIYPGTTQILLTINFNPLQGAI